MTLKRILFVVQSPPQFTSLWPYVEVLRKKFEIEFFFDERGITFDKFSNILDKEALKYHFNITSKKINLDYTFSDEYSKLLKLFYVVLGSLKLNRFKYAFFEILNEKIFINKFLLKNQYDIVVSSEDNTGSMLFFNFFKSKYGFKSVVIPFTIANHEEFQEAFYQKREYHIDTLYRKFIFTFFKKWTLKYKDVYFAVEYLPNIISFAILRLTPIMPMLSIGGNSSVVFFESDFVKDYYIGSGAKELNYKLVPNPCFKIFKEKMSDNIFKKMYHDKIIVLCALPPDFLPNENYKNYDDIVHGWCKVLTSNSNAKVFISLHPRANINDVKHITDQYDVEIINEPITNLMPYADVFVVFISSTIRFALTCKKPILNFEMFICHYSEYNDVKPVIKVKNVEDFSEYYLKLCNGDFSSEMNYYYTQKENYFGNLFEDHYNKILKSFCELC